MSIDYDKISIYLIGEAGDYRTQIEREFTRVFPRMEQETQIVTWEEYAALLKPPSPARLHYNALIHRAKVQTRATSFLQFGRDWANRTCQCKTSQLTAAADPGEMIWGILQKSLERVIKDFLDRTNKE